MAVFSKTLIAAGLALAVTCAPAAALPGLKSATIPVPASDVVLTGSKNGTKVKGYTERRGGYSYNQADSINTYGDSRSKFGSASSLRDPALDKQTPSGPFDHGFFFDSATGPRGGDAPYMN